MNTSAHQTAAYRILSQLGSTALAFDDPYRLGQMPQQATHLQQVFDPEWITGLPLPQAAPGQPTALIDAADFQRDADPAALDRAYAELPRTRLLEDAGARSDGWHSLVAIHLATVIGHRVICTLYQSRHGDRRLGAHEDAWHGIILQLRGAKHWITWPHHREPDQFRTEPGDVLLLPQGLLHDVDTPDHSAHMVFALTQYPLASGHHAESREDGDRQSS